MNEQDISPTRRRDNVLRRLLQRLRASLRLQFSFVVVLTAIVPMLVVTIVLASFVINETTPTLQADAFSELQAVRTLKANQIQKWFADRKDDALFARELVVARGTQGVSEGLSILSLYKDTTSQLAFLEAFERVASVLSAFAQSISGGVYQDIILADLEGDVVFAFDEASYKKNEADSLAFKNGLHSLYVEDMHEHPVRGPVLRIAAPVLDENQETVGVLILEMNPKVLNDIMGERTGLGDSGETYLVGQDATWRSDSRFPDQSGADVTVLSPETRVNTTASQRALQGETGTRIIQNYRGVSVLSSWSPLVIQEPTALDTQGTMWAIIAEIDESEALASVNSLKRTIALSSGVLLVIIGVGAVVLGAAVANRMVKPILGLAGRATRIAAGDLDTPLGTTRQDEVGVLARAFGAMTARLRDMIDSLQERADELAERALELDATQRITFIAAERLSPDELLGFVVDLIRQLFNLYHVQVYIVDEARNAAVLRESTGYVGTQLLRQEHHIPLDQASLVTQAIRQSQAVLVADVQQEQSHLPNPLLPDTRSELVAPLKVGERVIGALDAQDRTPGRFTPHSVTFFQALTEQIAFLFENSALLERITEQREAMEVFATQLRTAAEISGRLNAIHDPDRLLQEVVTLIHERFGLYHAHVYVLEEVEVEGEVKHELVVRAGSGEVGRVLQERRHNIPLGRKKSLVARAARQRQVQVINDTRLDSDFMPNPLLPQTRSEMAAPLVVASRAGHDEVLGVLDVQDSSVDRFSQADEDTFSTLAGQIAIALQNAAFVEEIQDIAAQLRQADRLKSQFLASMSHEIRTPLNSIIGFAEVLLLGISGDLPPGVEEDVQAIFDNGRNLLKIINDILDLAKIESGTLALYPEPIEIAPLLEEVKVNNAGLLVDKPVEILLQVKDDLPTLEADPVRVHQVLNNLVSNAVKFTKEGDVILRAFHRDDWLTLEVQDSGIGISEEDLARVFDRFEQAGDSKSRAKGTGLGLSIVRQLVEMHGGTIEARSTLGQGSTFSVRLPFQYQGQIQEVPVES
jgi:signal transduction histidine kinase/HAMP domain-containing protein